MKYVIFYFKEAKQTEGRNPNRSISIEIRDSCPGAILKKHEAQTLPQRVIPNL